MKILDTGIVYKNPMPHVKSVHAYFPSVVRLKSGRLVVSYATAEAFEAVNLHSVVSFSDDNGKTWSEPKSIFSVREGWSDSCKISMLESGEIICVLFLHDRRRPNTGLTNPETQGFTETEFYITRSKDGETWSTPVKMTEPLVGPSFELCCPIVSLSDGTLVFPTSTWSGWDGYCPNGRKMVVFVSKDNGTTWDNYVDVMTDINGETIFWESKVSEFSDGRQLATAWIYDSKNNVDKQNGYVIGKDLKFSDLKFTGISGQTMETKVIANDKILSVYRRMDKKGLWANLAHLENDEWINDEELLLWSGGDKLVSTEKSMSHNFNVLRFGAPSMIMLDEKTAFVCFWGVEDMVSVIRWYKFEI